MLRKLNIPLHVWLLIGVSCMIDKHDAFLVDDTTSGQQTCSCGPCTCEDVKTTEPRPVVTLANGLEVVCDTTTDEGGWIVIQRRASADVDFYQTWRMYKYGFGNVHGNFWIGLEKIHQLTSKRRYELRVDLGFNGTDVFAHYDHFSLMGESENYEIQVSGYSGTAGDSLDYHNGAPFSTKDKDNDGHGEHCAVKYHGAWWYKGCHNSNLNGQWGSHTYGVGVDWLTTSTHR